MITKAQEAYRANLVAESLAKRAAKRPAIPLTDPAFAYVPSYLSDIRERFKRVRAELAAANAAQSADTNTVISIFELRRAEADDARR